MIKRISTFAESQHSTFRLQSEGPNSATLKLTGDSAYSTNKFKSFARADTRVIDPENNEIGKFEPECEDFTRESINEINVKTVVH